LPLKNKRMWLIHVNTISPIFLHINSLFLVTAKNRASLTHIPHIFFFITFQSVFSSHISISLSHIIHIFSFWFLDHIMATFKILLFDKFNVHKFVPSSHWSSPFYFLSLNPTYALIRLEYKLAACCAYNCVTI